MSTAQTQGVHIIHQGVHIIQTQGVHIIRQAAEKEIAALSSEVHTLKSQDKKARTGAGDSHGDNSVGTTRSQHAGTRMLIHREIAKASEQYTTSAAPAHAARPKTLATLSQPPQTLSRDGLRAGASSLDMIHNVHNLSPDSQRRAAGAAQTPQSRPSLGAFASSSPSKSHSVHERSSWGGPAASPCSPNSRAMRPHTSHASSTRTSEDMLDNLRAADFEIKYVNEYRSALAHRGHLADSSFDLRRDRPRPGSSKERQEEARRGGPGDDNDTSMASSRVSKSRILALRNSGALGTGYAMHDDLDVDMDRDSGTYNHDTEALGSHGKSSGIMRYGGKLNYREGYLDDSHMAGAGTGAQGSRHGMKGDVDGYDLLGIRDRQDSHALNSGAQARERQQRHTPADVHKVKVMHDEDVEMHHDVNAKQTRSKYGGDARMQSPGKSGKSGGGGGGDKPPPDRRSVLTFSDLASLW
jgi:hypothetical protein